jgi:hypothetical protein
VVFAAGRRENVVLADSLVFPNHQVCPILSSVCLASASRKRVSLFVWVGLLIDVSR